MDEKSAGAAPDGGARAWGDHLAPASVISGEPAGWKAGLGASRAQALGLQGPLVGRLASERILATGAEISVTGWTSPRLEPELAVRLGRDVPSGADDQESWDCVAAIVPAFELVDITAGLDDIDAMLSTNIYHRAVVLGAPVDAASLEGARLPMRLRRGRESIARSEDAAAAIGGIRSVVAHVARVIDAAGERLHAGDLIMTGTVVPPPLLATGGSYTAEFGILGSVEVRISAL